MITTFNLRSEAYKVAHGRRLTVSDHTLLATLARVYLAQNPAPKRRKQTRAQREIAELERMFRLEDPRNDHE